MKILIVSPKYYPDTFPVNLIAEHLVSMSHEVDVLTSMPFDNSKYNIPKTIENGVTVNRVKTAVRTKSTMSLVRYYLTLHKEFKKWIKRCDKKYDVTYTYSVSPVIALAAGNLYKKRTGTPHVAHILDIWPESTVATGYIKKDSLLYKILHHWSKKLYQDVDKILIGTESFASYLKYNLGITNKPVSYLPQPGLVFDASYSENPYDTKKTNIIYCGNIAKLQLVNFIVPAMKEVNNENVVFHIVGKGSYLEELEKEIKDNNLNNVIYHGGFDFKESARFIYHSDSIFISLKSGGIVGKTIPNKLISSLYYSKPIIGMVTDESEHILRTNDNIIATQTINGLSSAINRLTSLSSKDRELIGKKNRQYYDDHFSIDKFSEKLLGSLSSK